MAGRRFGTAGGPEKYRIAPGKNPILLALPGPRAARPVSVLGHSGKQPAAVRRISRPSVPRNLFEKLIVVSASKLGSMAWIAL
jgi:hypothetical protein